MRALIGFIVAPGLPALLLYVFVVATRSYRWVEVFPIVLGLVSYAAAFGLGLPAYLILHYLGRRSFAAYLLAGLVVGLLTYGMMHFGWPLRSAPLALFCVIYGALLSALFWLIAVWSRRS
jgi:hypothetical protein